MKTKKHYLILAVVTTILCVPAPGEIELPLPEDEPLLIGRAHPELAGIEQLYVAIMREGVGPSKDEIAWKELRAKVENKLVNAGLRMYAGNVRTYPTDPAIPVLRIDMDMLKLKDVQRYVFCVRTSLLRQVYLAQKTKYSTSEPSLIFRADVWKSSSSIQAVSVQNMPALVTGIVLQQVEAFIRDWRLANPKGKPPAAQQDAAKYTYVASKNSKVFHKPDCRSAKRIKPANLVGYNSRNEAIEAGKRPCKVCKP